MRDRPDRIALGTRGSPLARAQAELARRALLAARPGTAIDVVIVRTSGDRLRDRPLADIGGKGLFTRELDAALRDGRVDIAVHSLKDVPSRPPDDIALAFPLKRADPRDAWIARDSDGPDTLARSALVGTSSPRRAAQLLRRRPDLRVVPLRGNVGRRLDKVDSGVVDATLLAVAGLQRLGRAGAARAALEPDVMLPAAGQGTIAVAFRRRDARARELLAPLEHAPTAAAAAAERAMLARLDGSCRAPIAGLARAAPGGAIALTGLIARLDGSEAIALSDRAPAGDAAALGDALGARLAERGGPGFLPP